MKNRLLLFFATLVAVATLFPLSSRAVTTTALLSQDFSGATFPPAGWSANWVGQNFYYGGWYRSSGGNGGLNGSATAFSFYGYQPGCYGSSYTNMTLTTPTVNTSSFTAADSLYLDFDLWFPYNYYQAYYSPYQEIAFTATSGSTNLVTANSTSNCTFFDPRYGYSDPSSYTSSSYWRHYHVLVPSGSGSVSVVFKVTQNGNYCYFGYMYTDNIAIDNVTLTDYHYDVLTFVGPQTINFGNVPYLATAGPYYSKVAVPTANARAINLSNYRIVGTNAGDFTLTRAPSQVAIGGTDSIGVTYTPQAAGNRSATLVLNTDADAPTSLSIGLTGFGLRPIISLPQGLQALFTHQWARFRTTITQSFLVTNAGLVPLHIDPASYIGGDFPAQYSLVRLPSAPIGPGQSDTITVSFSPTIEGLMTATLFIMSDAQNGTQTVQMRGLGILPRLTVNNMYQNTFNVNFDSVNVGADSCMFLTLYNPGTDTIAITHNYLSSKDYDFTMTPLAGTDTLIPPGSTKNVQVCFHPLKQGFREATVRFTTNIPLTFDQPNRDTSSFVVNFSGTGVPVGKFALAGPALTDSIMVGTQHCQQYTLSNLGAADINVSGLTITGANSSDFSFSGLTFPFVLGANSTKTFTVCAKPGAMNDRLATITAMGTTNGEPITTTSDADVFGLLSADSIVMVQNFPSVTCLGGMPDTGIIKVINTGNISTQYAGAISGANASEFAIIGSTTSSMQSAGGAATFTVTFTPDVAHANTASNASFNVTGGPGGTLALTAKGGAATITGSGSVTAPANSTAANFTVNVQNNGLCSWTPGNGIQVSDPQFSYVSGGTTAIAPGGSGQLTFSFAPKNPGTFNATVTFPNAVGVSVPAANVTLTGTASGAGVTMTTEKNGYKLEQNYPNPFSNESEIEITLPTSSQVRLVVLDQKGAVVRTVLNQRMGEGTFSVRIPASDLTSGNYYYQLTAGDVVLTRQMTIVK